MNFIQPNWQVAKNIKAFTSIREGGVSKAPYDQFNTAHHVGDEEQAVKENRALLMQHLNLKNEPIWLNQTHSTIAIAATTNNRGQTADASYTSTPHQVCAILTADCLPILLCHPRGTLVAAIHAGWRGLANGIIENTLQALNTPVNELYAWLGPAISQQHFEVGSEVQKIFTDTQPEAKSAFIPSINPDKWMADLYALARLRLNNLGLTEIYGANYCTFSDQRLFYSYRRDGKNTGRIVSLIWLE